MKSSLAILPAAASAAGGFGLAWVIAGYSLSTPNHPGNSGASSSSSILAHPVQPHAASQNSGEPLILQFRTALNLLGIPGLWAEELAACDVSGFPALLERIKALPARQRKHMTEFLLGRWVELDPVGGADLLESTRGHQDGDLTDFLRHWARVDSPAALAKAEHCGPTQLSRTLRDRAVLDPEELLQWLGQRPDLNPITLLDSGSDENRRAWQRLSEQDPQRMLAWSRQVPEDKLNHGLLQDLAAALAKTDPEQALAWAKSLKDTARSHAALAGAAAVLAASDPERALQIAAEMKPSGSYDPAQLQYQIARKLDLSDAAEVLGWVEQLPVSAFRSALTKGMVVKQLEIDPAKAFALAASLGPEAGMMHFIEIPGGMATSPEAARVVLEAAAAAGNSSLRETASKEALLRWMEISPASLADYLRDRMDTPLMQSMKEHLQAGLGVQQMRDGAADPALSEITKFTHAAFVKELAVEHPEKAIAELDKMEDPETRRELTKEMADNWARYNRTAVMDWAAGLQDPVDQASAWRAAAAAWTKEDSWQASQWVAGLPQGQGRDAAVQAMTSEISRTDPDLAWNWALSMTDPNLRSEALSVAALSWRMKDPASLQAVLHDPALPAAERVKVMEKLRATEVP